MKELIMLHYFAFQGGLSIHVVPLLLIIVSSVIAGVCEIVAGAGLISTYRRGWPVVAAGVLRTVFVFPFGIFALMLVIAGAIEIAAAIRLRKHVKGTVFFALAGVTSILSLFLLSLSSMLGGSSMIYGTLSLAFGLAMRSSRQEAP